MSGQVEGPDKSDIPFWDLDLSYMNQKNYSGTCKSLSGKGRFSVECTLQYLFQ